MRAASKHCIHSMADFDLQIIIRLEEVPSALQTLGLRDSASSANVLDSTNKYRDATVFRKTTYLCLPLTSVTGKKVF